jgi:predicted nucleic acid-binding protein
MVRQRVHDLLRQDSAVWCDLIRLELWNGVRGDEERKNLAHMDQTLPRLPISSRVWDSACELASQARKTGLNVPSTDLVIFACAKTHNVAIEHSDHHFLLLEKLRTL